MTNKYNVEYKIRSYNVDMNQNLAVKNLCDMINDISGLHSEVLGVSVDDLNRDNQSWVLSRMHLVIDKLPQRGKSICIDTWPSGSKGLYACRDYIVNYDDKQIVKGTSAWLVIDIDKRRPIKIPETIVNSQIPFADIEPAIIDDFRGKIETLDTTNSFKTYNANYTDIDFNKHVTATKYVEWIVNELDIDIHKQYDIAEIDIAYKLEIILNSEMHVSSKITEQNNDRIIIVHQIISDDNKKIHCQAKTVWRKRV